MSDFGGTTSTMATAGLAITIRALQLRHFHQGRRLSPFASIAP
jgi:hypothetical protein